jgi:hypothetical protein
MRISGWILSLLLVGLLTPAAVGAETTVYFMGYAMSIAPPLVLLVCGLALLAIGIWFRRFLREATQEPEPEIPDVSDGPASQQSSVMIASHVADAAHADSSSADPSEIVPDVRRVGR